MKWSEALQVTVRFNGDYPVETMEPPIFTRSDLFCLLSMKRKTEIQLSCSWVTQGGLLHKFRNIGIGNSFHLCENIGPTVPD